MPLHTRRIAGRFVTLGPGKGHTHRIGRYFTPSTSDGKVLKAIFVGKAATPAATNRSKYTPMKFTRKAGALWKGSGKEGKGTLTTASGVLENTPYSFSTRFTDEKGTNPEELVGAAHAGCFAMKLSFLIGEAGFTPESLDVKASVTFEDGAVTKIHLDLVGKVPGMDAGDFKRAAENAKQTCPISNLLKAEISLAASMA